MIETLRLCGRYWRRVLALAISETREHWLGSTAGAAIAAGCVSVGKASLDAWNTPDGVWGAVASVFPSWTYVYAFAAVAVAIIVGRMIAIPPREESGPLAHELIIEERDGCSLNRTPQSASVWFRAVVHNRSVISMWVRIEVTLWRVERFGRVVRVHVRRPGELSVGGLTYSDDVGIEIPGGLPPQEQTMARTFHLTPQESAALSGKIRVQVRIVRVGDAVGEVREFEPRTTEIWGQHDLVRVRRFRG